MADPAPPTEPQPVLAARFKMPPETIQDGNITLRRWRLSDADAQLIAAQASLLELKVWMSWAKDGYTRESAESFLKLTTDNWDAGKEFDYALLVDGQVSGSFGLMEPMVGSRGICMGYWVATPATGKGLATRAAGLLTRTAFAMGADMVQICHHVDNARSKAVPKRLGYVFVGEGEVNRAHIEGKQGIWQIERKPEGM